MKNKTQNIIGLLIGICFYIFLFLKEQYAFNFYYKGSIIINNLYPLVDSVVFGNKSNVSFLHPMRIATVENYALTIWYILSILYLVFIWRYRGCIAYYPIKIVKIIYKKI